MCPQGLLLADGAQRTMSTSQNTIQIAVPAQQQSISGKSSPLDNMQGKHRDVDSPKGTAAMRSRSNKSRGVVKVQST